LCVLKFNRYFRILGYAFSKGKNLRRIEWVVARVGKKEDEENRMILQPSQLLRNLMIRIEAEEVVTGVTGGHGGVGAGMTRILKVLQMTVVVIGMRGRENLPGKLLKRK
jgi:hypothetical protein